MEHDSAWNGNRASADAPGTAATLSPMVKDERETTDWLRLLDRELYWRSEGAADLIGATEDLRARLDRLAETLRADLDRGVPAHEPSLREGSRWRKTLKRSLFRAFRPVTRRNDRVAAELAGMTADLVDRVAQTQAALQRLDAEVVALRKRSDLGRPAGPEQRPAGPSRWDFDASGQRAKGLRRYEQFAADVRSGADGTPLWLDLGCGRGELLKLVDEWGFRAVGVEPWPEAVADAADAGARVVEGDPVEYLLGYEEEPPEVISAIGLLEHLPAQRWPDVFRGAHRVLATGGSLLVETLDPSRAEGLVAFFSDPTMTRPVSRAALRRLAEQGGFREILHVELGERRLHAIVARV